MWIEKRQTNKGVKYKYIERYTDPLTHKEGKVSVTLGQATAQAKKQAFILLQEKINEKTSTIKPELLTFKEVAYEWLEYNSNSNKPATIRNNSQMLRSIINRLQKDILLHKVTANIIQSLLNTIYYDEGKSYQYSYKHFILIRQIYKYAFRLGYIGDIQFINRVELKRKPYTHEEIQKALNHFLTKEELKSVLQQLKCKHPRIAKAMEFIALTGLRFGELTALRNCDCTDDFVSVNGTIVTCISKADNIVRGTPKNIYSNRTVPINNRAKEIIQWFKADNKRLKLWTNSYNDRGYIFTSKYGAPMNVQYVNKILRTISIDNKRISTHIFRHTHISLLSDMNIPLKAIMDRVGHNDPRTTLSIYTHVSDNAKKEIVDKLNAIKVI